MKRKPGRPPRAGKVADRLFTVRLTHDEYATYERAAKASGLSVSQWLRRCAANRLTSN